MQIGLSKLNSDRLWLYTRFQLTRFLAVACVSGGSYHGIGVFPLAKAIFKIAGGMRRPLINGKTKDYLIQPINYSTEPLDSNNHEKTRMAREDRRR